MTLHHLRFMTESNLPLVDQGKQRMVSRRPGGTTESELQEARCRLLELKAQGVITDDEETRRNTLIMHYMEYQQSEEDEEQSITLTYVLSTVQSAFLDCFVQTSRMFYSGH